MYAVTVINEKKKTKYDFQSSGFLEYPYLSKLFFNFRPQYEHFFISTERYVKHSGHFLYLTALIPLYGSFSVRWDTLRLEKRFPDSKRFLLVHFCNPDRQSEGSQPGMMFPFSS
jgi:hypothetical protein